MAAPCGLLHLSGIALKHVAASYGIEPHQDREALLQDITGHLLQTLPYRLAIDSFPASQSVAGYGFSLAAYNGLIYLFGGRNGGWPPCCLAALLPGCPAGALPRSLGGISSSLCSGRLQSGR
jgi:hypothetical protein